MLRAVVFALWLAVTWLLWSGHSEALILAFGAASVAVAIGLGLHLGIVDEESEPYHLGARPLSYVPWLLWEIAKSNLHVARTILSPRLVIRPRLLRVPCSQKSDLGRVIYANSITLTPGTVTLDVRDGALLVHALTDTTAEGLLSGEMDRRVTRLEGSG